MTTTSFVQREVEIFKGLLYDSAYRGIDSTGMFTVSRKNLLWSPDEISVSYLKIPVESSSFIKIAQRAKMFEDIYNKRVFVGHCRSATIGSISKKNAHPFDFENVIGVHNGTVRKAFKYSKDFETDSEALFKNIDEDGIDKTIDMISAADGAYALAYFDKKTNEMNFIRNSQRPLYFSYADNKKILLFASSPGLIRFVTDQIDVLKLQGYDSKTSDIWYIPENELFSFPIIGANDFESHKRRIIKVSKKVYSGYSGHGGYGGYGDYPWHEDLEEPLKETKEAPEIKTLEYLPTKEVVIGGRSVRVPLLNQKYFDKTGTLPGFRQEPMSKHRFNLLIGEGCSICHDIPLLDFNDPKDVEKISWYDRENYICPDCTDAAEDDWVRKFLLEDSTKYIH